MLFEKKNLILLRNEQVHGRECQQGYWHLNRALSGQKTKGYIMRIVDQCSTITKRSCSEKTKQIQCRSLLLIFKVLCYDHSFQKTDKYHNLNGKSPSVSGV
jgi:hypothetical protein